MPVDGARWAAMQGTPHAAQIRACIQAAINHGDDIKIRFGVKRQNEPEDSGQCTRRIIFKSSRSLNAAESSVSRSFSALPSLQTMLPLAFLIACAIVKTSLSQLLYHNSTGKSNTSVINEGLKNNVSHLLSEIPIPSPNQTLGSYVDLLLGTILGPRDLTQRHLIRTHSILTTTWALDQGYFNVSLDRCLQFSTVAGIYTAREGTKYNATILDINRDLRNHGSTNQQIEQGMASRVLENAQLASREAEAYLNNAICGFANAHEELRRLLAPDGYYVALMTKSVMFGTVGASVYTGILNRNASIGQAIGVTISAAGLTIMDGIIGRLQGLGRLSFLEATIINCFTAWYRRAVVIGVDSQESICIPQVVVHDAMAALPVSSDPSFYFDALSEIELQQMCDT